MSIMRWCVLPFVVIGMSGCVQVLPANCHDGNAEYTEALRGAAPIECRDKVGALIACPAETPR